jgi:hypothetical protein
MWLPALKLKAQQTSAVPSASQPYNIVFVISDQEADHLLATGDYELPARDELKRRGVVFRNHYIASAMCTPSRAAFLSGQPPQVNALIDVFRGMFATSPSRIIGFFDESEKVVGDREAIHMSI